MSNNDINKNFPVFTEFKYPVIHSANNSLIEELISNTPRKDLIFHFKPQMNMNNILLNMNNFPQLLMSDLKSPNKFSSLSLRKKEDIFDPSLFINGYNSSNKNNNNSEFDQEKINSNLYFNSKKKTAKKKLLGKKRLFKYILSSEKKIKNEGNKNIDITQISLHGYHLINLQIIENIYEIKNHNIPKTLIKLLNKKYKYFKLLHLNNSYSKNKEYNLDKINLTLMELQENNLDYYKKETDSINIIKNYCDDMNKEIEKIKNNYINKKRIIFVTKSILLLELLIRNCNLFTNYILKKINQNQINDNNKNTNIYINNTNANSQKISQLSNTITPKFILIPPKPSIQNINNKPFINSLPENNNSTSKKTLLGNTNTNSKNLTENNIFINKQKTLFRAKIPLMNTYKCDFCDRVFKNGQALGGHISQSHPKQSNKYKQKIEIRNSRTDRRELLYEAKRRLFKSYHIDYEYLLKNKRKNEIKMFTKVHKNEYKKELLYLKSIQRNESYNIPNSNDDINIKKILNTSFTNSNDNNKKIIEQNQEK